MVLQSKALDLSEILPMAMPIVAQIAIEFNLRAYAVTQQARHRDAALPGPESWDAPEKWAPTPYFDKWLQVDYNLDRLV